MKDTGGVTSLNELSAALRGKKVFLFDFDGVLVNSIGDIALSINATLTHFGFPSLDEEAVRGFVGDGTRLLVSRSFSAAGKAAGRNPPFLEEEEASWLSYYTQYYETHATEKSSLYPGVLPLLKRIRECGGRAAVVTNKTSLLSEIISKALGMAEYLDAIVGPEYVGGKAKPAPDELEEALRRINALLPEGSAPYTARDALMTGDSPQDVLAGKRFGCATCAVLKGYTAPTALFEAKADFYVNLAGDLRDVLA